MRNFHSLGFGKVTEVIVILIVLDVIMPLIVFAATGAILHFADISIWPSMSKGIYYAYQLAIVIGVASVFLALKTYNRNSSIKKYELITKTYDTFMSESQYNFYKRIQTGEQINFFKRREERLLNEALTMFDHMNYFRTQGLLDKRAWEYIACEIHNFALNRSVWDYMRYYQKQYRDKNFPEDIIPFTGFPDLFYDPPDKAGKFFRCRCYEAKRLPDDYKIKDYSPQVKKQFEKLLPEDQSKVKDIFNKDTRCRFHL